MKLVEFLISHGAELDLMDTQRWTAACFAADRGHGHVLRTLLDSGADPDSVTLEGQKLLDFVMDRPTLQELVEAAVAVKTRALKLFPGR